MTEHYRAGSHRPVPGLTHAPASRSRMNADTDSANNLRAQIVDREAHRTAALVAGRLEEVADIYDDRLIYTHSNGWRDDKQSLLTRSRDGLRYESIEHRLNQVDLVGDVAVTTGHLRAVVRVGNRLHDIDSLTSTVWSRRDSAPLWTLLLFHSSPNPEKDPPQ
ncbi:nuclear transport factor 2 family protein [Rhodococcus sp. G-MC3]|uniref:nuclear transport factor 2 family protein n=1 Tax=Rhodococcus sp. G-MC3 TaxID=3046209 RepID=UPI0024B9B821|nr:nuclear transport factor 2 family protein [Rhodococcus sp. G-MC3]MDJ0396401.1 nuclear transport factor 2 family protein [Rhodococcus sp. G-MC3]